jgi:hypothetical protein
MGRKRESLLLAGLAAVFTVYHIVSSHHNVEHDLRTHAAHAQSLREKAVRGSTARGAPVRHVRSPLTPTRLCCRTRYVARPPLCPLTTNVWRVTGGE